MTKHICPFFQLLQTDHLQLEAVLWQVLSLRCARAAALLLSCWTAASLMMQESTALAT
jgi:hypothetical protein